MGADGGPTIRGVTRIERHQSRVVYPAVGIFECAGEVGLERFAGWIVAHVERARGGQQLATADMVVQEQPEPNHPGRSWPALRKRQDEAERPDDVRRIAPEHFALHQRFTHQSEFVIFEVAKPAMNELGGSGRSAAGEIVHFSEVDRIATPGGVAGDAAAVYSAADDKDVMDGGRVQASSSLSHCTIVVSTRKRFGIISK